MCKCLLGYIMLGMAILHCESNAPYKAICLLRVPLVMEKVSEWHGIKYMGGYALFLSLKRQLVGGGGAPEDFFTKGLHSS